MYICVCVSVCVCVCIKCIDAHQTAHLSQRGRWRGSDREAITSESLNRRRGPNHYLLELSKMVVKGAHHPL